MALGGKLHRQRQPDFPQRNNSDLHDSDAFSLLTGREEPRGSLRFCLTLSADLTDCRLGRALRDTASLLPGLNVPLST
jgi:hypothetical protein